MHAKVASQRLHGVTGTSRPGAASARKLQQCRALHFLSTLRDAPWRSREAFILSASGV